MISVFNRSKRKLIETQIALEELSQLNDQASLFLEEIVKGNVNQDIPESLLSNKLGTTIKSLKEYLQKISVEEEKRAWLNAGLAKFSDILRNKKELSLKDLTDDILMHLVKYVNANQGAIFTLDQNDGEDSHLRMLACYAYNRKKFIDKRIELGEGLAGQCALEKEVILLKVVPSDYVHITSGLGDATPKAVLICPLLINENLFGVVELATFMEFMPHQIDFITKLSENIAATIKNVKDSEKNINLLNASQQQAEELRAQEEEMRQNMEELHATQEEMNRKTDEINRTNAEMSGVIEGINATMATIEFSPDGTIITANENFLKTMKCSLTQIQGKHHRIFAPKEIAESRDYQTFWTRLSSGQSLKGLFKRINFDKKIVWLNAIYNPIRDAKGNVIKVVKFASDVTAEQELIAQSKGIIEGINETMATIEFLPDGTIIKANENFLKTMKCNLLQIQGKHHKIFAPKEVLESDDYKLFWTRLSNGEPSKGIIKRINFNKEEVWLNAIYNPIKDASGHVVRVIKFATDVTTEQGLLARSKQQVA